MAHKFRYENELDGAHYSLELECENSIFHGTPTVFVRSNGTMCAISKGHMRGLYNDIFGANGVEKYTVRDNMMDRLGGGTFVQTGPIGWGVYIEYEEHDYPSIVFTVTDEDDRIVVPEIAFEFLEMALAHLVGVR